MANHTVTIYAHNRHPKMALNDAVAISGFFVNGLFRHPLDFYSSVGPTLSELTFGLCGESFVPERDIGDLTGKVVFVTGGTD